MNWLTIVVLIFWTLTIFRGFRRGFIRTLISTFFLILVLICTIYFSPKLRDVLMQSQNITAWAQTTCKSFIVKQSESGSYGWLSALPLPDDLTEAIAGGNESILGTLLSSDTVRTYLSEKLAPLLILLIAGVITFVISAVVLGIISHFLNKLARLPGVRVVNMILGLLLGIVKGLLLLWIFFMIVGVFSATSAGSVLMDQISGSRILKTLYDHNLLFNFLPTALSGLLKIK